MTKHRQRMTGLFARFGTDRTGSIVVIAALVLPIVLGFAALSVEYGNGLVTQVENQRVADMAAYAGALAYSESNSEEAMRVAADRVAEFNGVAPADLYVALSGSPRNSGTQVVHARVTTRNTLILAPIVGVGPDLDVAAEAYASLGEEEVGCILALDAGGSGVTVSGGGKKIAAVSCTVASNASIEVPCGAVIQAKKITYDGSDPDVCPWANSTYQPLIGPSEEPITPSKQYTADPLAGSAAVARLNARIADVRTQNEPSIPGVASGPDVDFSDDVEQTIANLKTAGCALPAAENPWYPSQPWGPKRWVITCGSLVTIGSVSVGGESEVEFNLDGGSSTQYSFSGSIQSGGGASLTFGDGQFKIAGGIVAGGGGDIYFGRGSFEVGQPESSWEFQCGSWPDDGLYSVCAGATVTFDGPSTFAFASGVYAGGDQTVRLGTGDDNQYWFGPSTSGTAIGMSGSGTVIMADALGDAPKFRVWGDISGGGGSCVVFPAAKQHDIAGNVSLAGTANLGAGIYTVDGYFSAGAGNVSENEYCGGVAIDGEDVTLVISGVETPGGWECGDAAFCIGGGNAVNLTAPTTGANANLAVIGPQASGNHSGAYLSGSGTGRISGAFYFPQGKIEMGGGGTMIDGGDGCLQLIGSSVTVGGGGVAASECVTSGSGSTQIGLVQ